MERLKWKNDMKSAQIEAGVTNKFILMFFHAPGCDGCRKSVDITFRDEGVIALLEGSLSMVPFLVTEAEDMTARYRVEWTPTFVMVDRDLRELERWVGYLPPEEFILQVRLSLGLSAMHMNRFKEAEAEFAWILDNCPNTEAAPKARYYLGVSLYKETGDAEHLVRTWDAMRRRYPGKLWTKKASAWSH